MKPKFDVTRDEDERYIYVRHRELSATISFYDSNRSAVIKTYDIQDMVITFQDIWQNACTEEALIEIAKGMLTYLKMSYVNKIKVEMMGGGTMPAIAKVKEQKATVESVFIGERHGLLTAVICFRYATGNRQCNMAKNMTKGTGLIDFIAGILKVFRVDNIYDIIGKSCIVFGTDERVFSVTSAHDETSYDF